MTGASANWNSRPPGRRDFNGLQPGPLAAKITNVIGMAPPFQVTVFSTFKRDGTIQLLPMVIDDVAMDATDGYLFSRHIHQIYSSV